MTQRRGDPAAVAVVGNLDAVKGEAAAVTSAARPATRSSLAKDLRDLGVADETTMIVHASLSKLGWVAGGARAVVEALLDVVEDTGTLVMPTHSTDLSEPSVWRNPPVPEAWWQIIRDETPAFDPKLTPTRSMGSVVECFRHYPGVLRSSHPQVSFAARGPQAEVITTGHSLEHPLGEGSPLARLYDLDGSVLLLGVGHGNNTALHLAEYRADYPGKEWTMQGAPVKVDGQRQWVTFEDLEGDSSDFEEIGAAFAASGEQRVGGVGATEARLMSVRSLVDFAVTWMTTQRGADGRS
jgi:aminoglycoside 3-N-acetyltransferase